MGIFSRKTKKERLVENFKNIISVIYAKIIIVDSLTFDPASTLQKDKDTKYSEFYETIIPLLDDWVKNEKLTPNELKFLQRLLAEDNNPIITDIINLSQFLKGENSIDQKTMRILNKAAGNDIREIHALLGELKKNILNMQQIFLEEIAKPVVQEKADGETKREDLSEWIILPRKTHGNYSYPDLLVSKERFYQRKNWNEAHELLNKEGCFMLTIRQFVDFLILLETGNVKDGNGFKLNSGAIKSILDDILTVRNPSRGEWLDANFKIINGNIHINYNHRIVKGKLQPENSDVLGLGVLIEDKKPGINLNSWIKSSSQEGLPTYDTIKGNIYYFSPRNNYVARFDANSDGAYLDCYRGAADSDAELGVRKAKLYIKK